MNTPIETEMNDVEKARLNMSPKSLALGLFIIVGLTVFSGAMQGRLANRWGPPEQLAHAGERLEQVPLRCGDWIAEKNLALSAEEERQLEPAGHLLRRYTNEKTGDQVTVTVLVGPHGPIAVHSPEICFSSRTYRQIGPRSAADVGVSGEDDQLWTLLFQSREMDAHHLRVYYGWSTGSKWQAASDARWVYARFSYLYKIQLAGVVSGAEAENVSENPCVDFLEVFLPQLEEFQIDPTFAGDRETEARK